MKHRGRLIRIVVAGIVLAVAGGIVTVCFYRSDGRPAVQALSGEKAEAVRQVARERGIIARYQNLARGQYNADEYARIQFAAEWDAAASLARKNRDAEYKKLQQRARQEIQARRGEFERALANSRTGEQNSAALNTLRRMAGDNLDFGLRIALLSLARQESALRMRKIKFGSAGAQMESAQREAEESAIKKQEEACRSKKEELNLVRNNRSSVVGLVVRQAGRQAN
jgi:hypothetical protein